MSSPLPITFEQIVPFSKARANFSNLIEEVKKKDYLVIAKKYSPAAALVNINYLAKLLASYEDWQREQHFKAMLEAATREDVTEKKIESDVTKAIATIRSKKKK